LFTASTSCSVNRDATAAHFVAQGLNKMNNNGVIAFLTGNGAVAPENSGSVLPGMVSSVRLLQPVMIIHTAILRRFFRI
jgi:hypothetical protein